MTLMGGSLGEKTKKFVSVFVCVCKISVKSVEEMCCT